MLVSDRGRIHFTHPLRASAVYGATSAQKRRRLHRRLADVVDDLEERARHLAMGIEGADEAAAAELERAAERAALRGAQEAAAELFDRSYALTPAQLPDDLARRRLARRRR